MSSSIDRHSAALGVAAPLAAAAAIAAAVAGSTTALYLLKPLATALLLALAWFAPRPVSTRYRGAVALGLAASLIGDVLLMLPGDLFVPGLVAFLIAHLAYLVAFTDGVRFAARPLTWALFLLLAGAILLLLWPGLPAALRIPVGAYAAALATMAAQAAVRWQLRAPGGTLAACGGLLFLASDTCLAYGRFRGALPLASLLILGTYYAAQWCIARSVRR